MIKIRELVKAYVSELDKYNIKSVLDLGCGNGRISLKFAERGIKTVGIDCAEQRISNLNFSFIKNDIKKFNFNEKYDLIIASFVLHFFSYNKALKIIQKMKDNTNNDGFNFLICMSDKDELFKKKPDNFYPNEKLLKEIYSNWEVIRKRQDFTEIGEHNTSGKHNHNAIFMLLRKIS